MKRVLVSPVFVALLICGTAVAQPKPVEAPKAPAPSVAASPAQPAQPAPVAQPTGPAPATIAKPAGSPPAANTEPAKSNTPPADITVAPGMNLHAIQKFNQLVIDEAAAHPERLGTNPKFASEFAKNYQIRLYDIYMRAYMDKYKLQTVPVPYEEVQKLIESADQVPHPILLEMIVSRYGSSVLINHLMNRISEYEQKNGLPASIAPEAAEGINPATRQAIDEVNRRLDEVSARAGGSSFAYKDIVLYALAGLALLISIAALAKKA